MSISDKNLQELKEFDLPWRFYTPISEQLEKQPTVLVAESLFIFFAIACLVHGLKTDKKCVLVWFCAIISGTMNDIFFMVLPFVDNFFHSQMTIMLTPRLPLYIPCAYASFMYVSVVASWKLVKMSPIGQSAVASLAGALFYAAYDMTGAKFLWWSWHTTDAAILERWHGVPIGSTSWTLVHLFVFSQLLYRFVLRQDNSIRFEKIILKGILSTGILATPLMMIAMGVCQIHQLRLDFHMNPPMFFDINQIPGKPDKIVLIIIIVINIALIVLDKVAWSIRKAFGTAEHVATYINRDKKTLAIDRIFLFLIFIYFGVLMGVMQFGDTESVISTGVHQTIGDCDKIQYDLSGYERKQYLCQSLPNPDFRICGEIQYANWFSICGLKHENLKEEVFPVFLYICMIAQGLYYFMLIQNLEIPVYKIDRNRMGMTREDKPKNE